MATPFSDDAARDAFLAEPRLAILMMNRSSGVPMGVPVWFEWTGSEVHMFAAAGSAKLRRLAQDDRVSVLVTNRVGEPEAWIAFDGRLRQSDEAAGPLVDRLGGRYWDMNDPEKRATLDSWIENESAFVLLTLEPERIRMGQ